MMESISSVTSCGKLIMYSTLRLWLRSKSFFGPQERFLAFSFFPRKLTAHFSNTYTYVIRAYPRTTSEMASLAAARRPYTDCFPSILFESQSALLQPRRFMHSRRLDRKRERECVAVDICGCGDRILMHFACVCVVVKICELMVPSPCRCGGTECRPLAQFAIMGCALNCRSSSRFRFPKPVGQN